MPVFFAPVKILPAFNETVPDTEVLRSTLPEPWYVQDSEYEAPKPVLFIVPVKFCPKSSSLFFVALYVADVIPEGLVRTVRVFGVIPYECSNAAT